MHDVKRTISELVNPTHKGITANNLISPPPIPFLVTRFVTSETRNIPIAPPICEKRTCVAVTFGIKKCKDIGTMEDIVKNKQALSETM